MPRLLLVDDNPSIHKIAETLLAGTDVALACVASGAEAIALIEAGESFDVAMLDISMMGMDGWELLAHLRKMEATARIPVAMMAGVLDVVDPERLRLAPIQGFFKKPVELRDLGDRVKRLMETPVEPPAAPPEAEGEPEEAPSPFITQPGFRVSDFADLIETPTATPEDLLLLGPEDLYPGEATVKATEVPAAPALPEEAAGEADLAEDSLDLEELDLEGLRNLTPVAEAAPEAPEDFSFMDTLPEVVPAPPAPSVEVLASVPDFAPGDADPVLPPVAAEEGQIEVHELPDLFPATDPLPEPAPAPAPMEGDFLDWADDSDSMLEALPAALDESAPPSLDIDGPQTQQMEPTTLSDILDPGPAAPPVEPTPEPAAEAPEETLDIELITEVIMADDLAPEPETHAASAEPPSPAPAQPEPPPPTVPEVFPDTLPEAAFPPVPAAGVAPAAAAAAWSAPTAAEGVDPLAALLADPVLMERLTKAVVARLGDQALREIAWEIMPELADRIHRN